MTGLTPVQVTIDKEAKYRSIKSRHKAIKDFKKPFSALRFYTIFNKLHQHFSIKNKTRSELKEKLNYPKEYPKVTQPLQNKNTYL